MNNNSSFTISHDYEIVPPKKGKAFIMPKREWDFLKEQIRKIKINLNIYFSIGALIFGISAQLFINILFLDSLKEPDGTFSQKVIICLVIAISTLAISLLLCFFGLNKQKEKINNIKNVVEYMEKIEE